MSTTINWKAINDKEQTRLILEHVMGYFIMPDDACKQGKLDVSAYPRQESFHWPIAFWNDDGMWWFTKDIASHQKPFDPLRDLNDAWLIIEKIETSARLSYTPAFIPQEPEGRVTHYECEIVELDPICGNNKIAHAIANTPTEAICIAALRWVGIQVTNTIEAIPCWQVTFEDGQHLIYRSKQEAERELASREHYLKANLRWAVNVRKLKIEEVNVRKLKIEEVNVPEDYFNGAVIA